MASVVPNDDDVTEYSAMVASMRTASERGSQAEERSPAHVRLRILRTVALYSAFSVLGATQSIIGPSLISMAVLLNVDTQTITTAITALPFGYLAGASLCGALYDILNRELLFLVGTLLIGIITTVAPSGDNVYLYAVALASVGFFCGGVDTAGQTYVIHLWWKHRWQWVMMLALHFIWASGSAIGPFMMKPFLVDIEPDDVKNVRAPSHSDNSTRAPGSGRSWNESVQMANFRESVAVVRHGFMSVGLLSAVPFLLFSTAFVLLRPSIKDKEGAKPGAKPPGERPRREKCVSLALLSFMALLFFVYNVVNSSVGSFVATFAVRGLAWPNDRGALVTSLYFGANSLGKALFVYPILRIRPEALNVFEMLVVLGGCVALVFSSWHPSVLWAAAAVVGLGMSSINATCFFWVAAHLTISGRLSSVVMASGSVGAMAAPALSGYLFDRRGPLAYVCLVLAAGALQLVTFVSAVVFSRKYIQKVADEARDARLDDNGTENE